MSDKNFEKKLKKHWREEADSIPVPDSLHPAKIEEMKYTDNREFKIYTLSSDCIIL